MNLPDGHLDVNAYYKAVLAQEEDAGARLTGRLRPLLRSEGRAS